MDIDQQLLELHTSFRINQELNGGDRSEQILWLITRLFDEALSPQPVSLMDMSLKDEMVRHFERIPGQDDTPIELTDAHKKEMASWDDRGFEMLRAEDGHIKAETLGAIVNQETPKEEPWSRFIILEDKKDDFKKFKLFLLEEGCSDEFWGNILYEDDEFFIRNRPINWIDTAFCWSIELIAWPIINTKWRALCK